MTFGSFSVACQVRYKKLHGMGLNPGLVIALVCIESSFCFSFSGSFDFDSAGSSPDFKTCHSCLFINWLINWLVNIVVNDIAIGAGGLGSIPGTMKSDTVSPTARHRCDVSSELCCPGANPRKWTTLLFVYTLWRYVASIMKI